MSATPLTRDEFIATFRGIYEASPHIAAKVWDSGAAQGPWQGLYEAFRNAVDSMDDAGKLALLRAHPDLAERVKMSSESTSEQAGAGLTDCTLDQYTEFQKLNDAYKAKFGFPFIIAVRGLDRERILAAFRHRLQDDREREFKLALFQVHRIAMLRLQDMLEGN